MPLAQAQEFRLPAPGVRIDLSPEFNPSILKGIKVHPDNPLRFDFILDQGDSPAPGREELKQDAGRLIKYFLASLTIPEKDLWVNLSPYEKDRIIPGSFGLTEMGRDLLAEDYMLKQITASLIYPEEETGRKFWSRVYEEAARKFGTTSVPVNTFNKVWIVPEKAVVYENAKAGTAYVIEAKLKVMLDQDYLSMTKHLGETRGKATDINALGSQIVREIVIPELAREVNEDRNFAQLRQVYNSLILATWYKKKIKDSILQKVYADQKKIAGVGYAPAGAQANDVEFIYQRYLQAFKKGVYNYIKEDIDPLTQQPLPRKYFSGGIKWDMAMLTVRTTIDQAMLNGSGKSDVELTVQLNDLSSVDELSKKTVSLYFSDGSTDDRDLFTRYSEFKLGVNAQTKLFAQELADRIEKDHGDEIRKNPDQWMLVTPAEISFGDLVSKRLGIKAAYTRWFRNPMSTLNYGAVASVEERLKYNAASYLKLEGTQPQKGQKVIFIDDMLNQGGTLWGTRNFIRDKFGADIIGSYVLLSIRGVKDASLENRINSFLTTEKGTEAIIKMINQDDNFITNYVVRYLLINGNIQALRNLIALAPQKRKQVVLKVFNLFFQRTRKKVQQKVKSIIFKNKTSDQAMSAEPAPETFNFKEFIEKEVIPQFPQNTEEERKRYSPERVTVSVPPTLVFHAQDDGKFYMDLMLREMLLNALNARQEGKIEVSFKDNVIYIKNEGDLFSRMWGGYHLLLKNHLLWVAHDPVNGSIIDFVHKGSLPEPDSFKKGSDRYNTAVKERALYSEATEGEVDKLFETPDGRNVLFFSRRNISFSGVEGTQGFGISAINGLSQTLGGKLLLVDDGRKGKTIGGKEIHTVIFAIKFPPDAPVTFIDQAMINRPKTVVSVSRGITVEVSPDVHSVYYRVARGMADTLIRNNDLGKPTVFICPTGGTQEGVYAAFIGIILREHIDFTHLDIFNMDEYFVGSHYRGNWAEDPHSYRYYLEYHLVSKLRAIDPRWDADNSRVHYLNGQAPDVEAEITRYENEFQHMRDTAGIDLEIGGIGRNGHIAFNEPIITIEDSLRMDVQKVIDYNEFWVKGDKKNWGQAIHSILFRHWNLRQEPVFTNYLENKLSRAAIEASRTNVHFLARALMSQKVTIYLDGLQPSDLGGLNHEVQELKKAFSFYRLSVEFKNSGTIFNARTRVVELSIPTIIDNSRFFTDLGDMPLTALTIGLGTVLDAKKIIIAATGSAKQEAVYSAVAEPENGEVSASILQRHKNVTFFIDSAAARVYRESGVGKIVQESDQAMTAEEFYKLIKQYSAGTSRPGQTGGTHFRVSMHNNLGISEKIPISTQVIHSVELATQRLGGIVANFILVNDGGIKVVLQEAGPSLKTVIEQKIAQNDREGVQDLLDQFFKLNQAIFQRGLINWDPTLENFGVQNGKVVLIDIGGLSDTLDPWWEESLGSEESSDVSYFMYRMNHGVPKEIQNIFNEKVKEYQFENGGQIFKQINDAKNGKIIKQEVDGKIFIAEVLKRNDLGSRHRDGVMSAVNLLDKVDDEGFRHVWQQIQAVNKAVTSDYYHPNQGSEQLMQDSLKHADPNLKYTVAMDASSNKIIGYVFFDTSMRYSKVVYISNLAVLPEYQGKRVGIQLVKHVLEYAYKLGHLPVQLNTASSENPALAFYDKLPENIPGVSLYSTGFEGKAYYELTYNPPSDHAMSTDLKRGGIDLTANMNLQTQNAGGGIKFHLDPAMLQQLQNASGFVPVIVNVQPMTDLRRFLGIQENASVPAV